MACLTPTPTPILNPTPTLTFTLARCAEVASSEHQAALQEAQRCVQIASEAVAKMEASEHSSHEARPPTSLTHTPYILFTSPYTPLHPSHASHAVTRHYTPHTPLHSLTSSYGCDVQALWRADMAEGAAVVAQAEASRLRDALACALAEEHARGVAAEAQAAASTQQRQELEAALVGEREALEEARASFAQHAPHRIPHRRLHSLIEEIGSPSLSPEAEVPGPDFQLDFESPGYAGPATHEAVSPSYSGPARR